MNTRLIACSVVAVVSLVGRAADAQSAEVAERPVSIGFMLGTDPYTGGFRGSAQGSRGGALGIEALVPLPSRHLALRADFVSLFAAGSSVCDVDQPVSCPVNAVPFQVTAWSADIVARLNERSVWWSPYALVGAAYYSYQSRDWVLRGLAHNGLQAGLGFEARTGKHTNVFAEWRYLSFGASGLAPITLGMRF